MDQIIVYFSEVPDKMMSIKNIKKRILKTFFIVILTSCALLLLFVGKLLYNELFNKYSKNELFQNSISSEIKKMSRLIESVQKIPQDLAYILEFHDADDMELKILLESVLFNNEELFGSAIAYEPYQFDEDSLYFAPYVYRSEDINIYTHLNDPEYNYFYKDWYLVPKTLLKPTWSEPYYDEGGGNLLMSTYSVPFYKFDGYKEKFNGIVTVDVSIEWLTKAVESMGKLWNGYTILISENGTVVYAPFKDWIYNETIFSLAAEWNLPVLREVGRELQKGNSGIKHINEFEMKKNWRVFYSSININKWGLVLLLPEEELY